MIVFAPISVGELFDKITILEIKTENYADIFKLVHVTNELNELRKLAAVIDTDISKEIAELKEVNKIIWDNEDSVREYGPEMNFDLKFMTIAANTYSMNTRRALIKQTINKLCNSNIVETKSYMTGEIQ